MQVVFDTSVWGWFPSPFIWTAFTFIYLRLQCFRRAEGHHRATVRNGESLIYWNVDLCFPPKVSLFWGMQRSRDLLEVCPGRGKAQVLEASSFFHKTSNPWIRWCWVSGEKEDWEKVLRRARGDIQERLLGEPWRAAHSSLLDYEMVLPRGLVSGFRGPGKQPQTGMGIVDPERQAPGGAPSYQHPTCGDRLWRR